MTDPSAEEIRSRHETHDRDLVAAFVAGDLAGRDVTPAAELIRDCPDCSALALDLGAITAATRRLPATLPAPRDFRLLPTDADGLRAGRWRRALRAAFLPRWGARPLAATLTTLGVAGLLLAAMPFMSLGPASGGPAPLANADTTNTGSKVAMTSTPDSAAPAAGPTLTVPTGINDTAASPAPGAPEFGALPSGAASGAACCSTGAPGAPNPAPTPSIAPGTTSPVPTKPAVPAVLLILASGALLLAGIGLFVVDRRSRRSR